MATGTAQHGSPQPQPVRDTRRNGRVVEYQQYIDAQLGRTRRRVKWVDLWTALATLAVGFTAYLLLAAVIDHWIVPGGLGTAGRWLLLVGLLAGVAVHLVVGIGPLFVRRVSSVYAAAAIEQGGRMKNTLINFLLLRRRPDEIPDGVLEAMKEQAAVRLAGVPDDAPVDRSGLLRWCYVLAAILIAALAYALASPKDSFRSIRRVITPWAQLAAPTRVRFENIEPGSVDKRRDDIVEVRVRAAGLRPADGVVLHFSATGNPADDVALPMQTDEGRYLWKTVLPPGSEGLKQDLFYYVQAGDATSERFRIRVLSTPVINVRSVRYDYPAYTGLPPRTVEKQGDLKALEGTRVSIVAEANQPIRAAHVAFDQARNKDVELKPVGLEASGGFDLALKKDRETPVHSSYLLRFVNIDGEENPKPVEHRIDVTADQPPEVRVVLPNSPPEKELSLSLGGIMNVTLAARDPDFQLAELVVVLEQNGRLMREERLLTSDPRYGEFSNTLTFNPERYKLKTGDKFTFRGRAADNKAPSPNVVETPRYTVVVTGGDKGQEAGDKRQQPGDGNPQRQPNDAKQQPNPNERGQPGDAKQPQQPENGGEKQGAEKQDANNKRPGEPGQQGAGEKQPSDGAGQKQEPGDKQQPGNEQRPNEQRPNNESQPSREPIDPVSNPADAFDELIKHFEQQDKQDEQKQEPGDKQEAGDKSREAGDKSREAGGKGQEPGEKKQQAGEKQAGDKGQESGGGKGQSQSGEGGAAQPKDGSGNPSGGKPQSGDKQQTGDKPEPGEKQATGDKQPPGPSKKDDSAGGGKPDGGAGEKQAGPDGGKPGDERQAGGADGVGRQGAEGAGQKSPGGKGNNQPAQNPGNEAAEPGGKTGTKTNNPSQNPAERRQGAGDGGHEAARKPTDDKTPGAADGVKQPSDPNDHTKQGAGPQQGGPPNDNAGGKSPSSNEPGERPEGAKPAGTQPGDERRPGEKTAAGQPGVKRDSNSSDEGSGAKAGGDEPHPDDKAKRPGEQNPDGTAGKPSVNENQPTGNTKNPGGNDGPAPKSDGSPGQQELAKPRDKVGEAKSDNQQESSSDKMKSPSTSKHESDSKGQTSGEQSGDGEEGGGQKSNKKGTGAAGQNTAGDQGGGTSSQEGDQAASDKPGDKVRGNDPSQGKPSGRSGEGEKSDQPGEKAGGDSQGSSKAGEPSNTGDGDQQPGAGPGGGGDRTRLPQDTRTVAPPADEVNLDYTRQVTDLTLDRLKQQLDKGQVDPELLKRFTSPEALAEAARRWEAMRAAARDPSPAGEPARKQYEETLKSLGLRPGATTQKASTDAGDDFRAVRGARRSEPPAKWVDHYRAYSTGVGRSDK